MNSSLFVKQNSIFRCDTALLAILYSILRLEHDRVTVRPLRKLRQTDRPTNQPTDMRAHRELTRPIRENLGVVVNVHTSILDAGVGHNRVKKTTIA